MGIGLNEAELWDFVADARTAVVTTLRRDGWPVSLPVWFVVLNRSIYFKTFPTMRKVARIVRDRRAAFVVQDGGRWTDLRAVSLSVTAEILAPGDDADAARLALGVKYPPKMNVPVNRLPEASRAYYAGDGVIVRLNPAGPPISWDNRRLRLLPADGG